MSAPTSGDTVKAKIRQLYEFLREVNLLRFRPIRSLGEQPKVVRLADVPTHPAIQIFRPVRTEASQDLPDTLLRVRRPALTHCPKPPRLVASWLLPNWDDPARTASVAESQNTIDAQGRTVTVRFDSDPERVVELNAWLERRNAWVGPEQAARKAMSFFEVFYDIHSTMEKDGEQLELVAADGHIFWQASSAIDGTVRLQHPVLLKRVELRFDPNIPEFTVHETERETELYSGLFVDLEGIAPAAINNRKGELEKAGYHPLGWEDTEAFLKAFIQTVSPVRGEYLDEPPRGDVTPIPQMYRDMVLILRKRTAGIANAVDAIISDIDHQVLFPPALAQITGTEDEWKSLAPDGIGSDGSHTTNGDIQSSLRTKFSDDDILLAEEANEEQMQIIRRLVHSGSVIVQGPPGTGKTHTIGNLIGHLLAQGKSVLVTAQTAKALRVLRDKVPEMLRPLTVSVLGSDQDARKQLESSIGSITEKLTQETGEGLLEKARRFEIDRKEILVEIKEQSHKLREALENEYREISVGERRFTPSDAARFVSENRELNAWIPSPVVIGCDLNLTARELVRLYALGDACSPEEEHDARLKLPELSALPSERQFEAVVTEYRSLTTANLSLGEGRWGATNGNSQTLAKLAEELSQEFSSDLLHQAWRPYAIVAGIHGGVERDVWEQLVACITATVASNGQYALLLHQRSQLAEVMSAHKQRAIAVQICEHLDSGGKLGFLQLTTHPEWRQFIKNTSVAAGQPNHREHFESLRRHAELEVRRAELEMPWNEMIGRHIQQPFSSLGGAPEMSCRAIVPEVVRCLDWNTQVWMPLVTRLKAEGFDLELLAASISLEASQVSEYLAIERLATELLPPLLSAEIERRRLRECEHSFRQLADLVTQVDPTSPDRGCVARILSAVRSQNVADYVASLSYARRLHALKPPIDERDKLIEKIRHVAPGWAEQISHRIPPHNTSNIPGDITKAWTWRQLNDELVERDRLDVQEVQRQIDRLRRALRELTQHLIDAGAWGKQIKRLQNNNSMRQALVGWLDTMKRLVSTRQIDRRQTLQSEARKLMKRCADAVPVWIMPIPIVAESFEPISGRFDVVIIDEASQADLNALIPLYLGKQVIVVGDHEQVTPLGVGKAQTILNNLRKSMLKEIPNSHLFDNMSSIYDIARQSFGDAIRLVEHFRCVPEIISFSNQLSYEGKIRPLRESNSANVKPACISRQVGGFRDGDINKAEAKIIIDYIRAMVEHPVYARKSIGVISMLGEQQAQLIQSMLHKEIPVTEIETRRIQAGISGEFQGDERDIIFLSMVDSASEEGPLRTIGEGAFEQTKKRYNVAVSRAKDQLWVVHSFDPDLHLKSGDLRLKLMNHIRAPLASIRAYNEQVGKTESPFEREVLKRLTDAGFRVKSQWQVGYYRIDMVIEGAGKRLALECDGDRYHPMEKLAEDMERQSILERLGWQFVRIRGSAFYRNPDSAMRPVFDRLAELEIPPEVADAERATPDMQMMHELDEIVRRQTIKADLEPEVQ